LDRRQGRRLGGRDPHDQRRGPARRAHRSARRDHQLDQIVGEKTWAAVGPKLSERERGRRALLAQAELARQKIAARDAEVERQIGLARQHAEERVQRLRREQELAVKKQTAYFAELNRQKQLVQDRAARDVAEQQQAAEARRQAEMRRLAAAQPPLVQQAPTYAAPAQGAWAAAPAQGAWAPAAANSAYHGVPAGQGWSTQPSAAGGVSSSTQQWLQSQSVAPAPSAVAVPAQQPGFATNAGVSPATQRWLAQQQMR
jgi:type II secretory pathway pseudopilin PulG